MTFATSSQNSQRRMILASASPRRLDILQAYGHCPEVYAPDIDESLDDAIAFDDLNRALESLATNKAQAVLGRLRYRQLIEPDETILIIAADTVVYADGIIGKPADHDEAVASLLRLRNRSHHVVTAVAVILLPEQKLLTFAEQTVVSFADYGLSEIEAYINTDPPFDKAGAYAIQGIWRNQITALEGDIENVVGLPYRRLVELVDL